MLPRTEKVIVSRLKKKGSKMCKLERNRERYINNV